MVLGSLLVLVLIGGGTVCFGDTWERYPWISLSGGYESDRILEQGADRLVVEGGGFFDLTPGILFGRDLDGKTRVNIDGRVTLEQFGNDDSRSLVGAGLAAELRRRISPAWQWRVSTAGDYFADSAQETVDRFHGGAEVGLGWFGPAAYLEALAGGHARRNTHLVVYDAAGTLGNYTELGVSLGAEGAVAPWNRVVLSARAMWQTTRARDPLYDARALLARAGTRVRLAGWLWLVGDGLLQERSFTERTIDDSDTYWQVAGGADITLGGGWDVGARYAFARYTDPTGHSDDVERFSVGLAWWPEGRGVRSLPPVLSPIEGLQGHQPVREDQTHLFRVRAPGAREVSLVGDFNAWDTGAQPLRAAGDGWWEVRVALPAGTYQYAFWVDGDLVTPPEAETTIDDGFGGRNGVIHVEPKGL